MDKSKTKEEKELELNPCHSYNIKIKMSLLTEPTKTYKLFEESNKNRKIIYKKKVIKIENIE